MDLRSELQVESTLKTSEGIEKIVFTISVEKAQQYQNKRDNVIREEYTSKRKVTKPMDVSRRQVFVPSDHVIP